GAGHLLGLGQGTGNGTQRSGPRRAGNTRPVLRDVDGLSARGAGPWRPCQGGGVRGTRGTGLGARLPARGNAVVIGPDQFAAIDAAFHAGVASGLVIAGVVLAVFRIGGVLLERKR